MTHDLKPRRPVVSTERPTNPYAHWSDGWSEGAAATEEWMQWKIDAARAEGEQAVIDKCIVIASRRLAHDPVWPTLREELATAARSSSPTSDPQAEPSEYLHVSGCPMVDPFGFPPGQCTCNDIQ